MKPADALADLLARVAAADGAAAVLSGRELAEWPAAAVGQIKAEQLLVKGPPADAVTCPGCEEDCTMPVESAITPGGQLRAFVMCDKRDDVGRVSVATDLIEQWRCSPERLADVLARQLGIRRSEGDAAAARWTVGVLKGAKHSAHVVLDIGRGMQLSIAGHTLALADVLELGDEGLALDRVALARCVDNPTVDGLGSVSCRPAAAKEVNATIWPNPQSMTDLRSHEVSIAFIGDKAEGLAGNNMLEIRARGVVRRVSLAELDLVDRRRGTLNHQAAVLVGLANGEALRRSQESASATMRRLRSALRTYLGIIDDPFHPYRKETGWLPSFKLMDLRGLADQRAELAAERRMVPAPPASGLKSPFSLCIPEFHIMSMADRDGVIWYDGKLVPWRDATTHVLTHTLHYGMGVFEGVRAYETPDGTSIFRLQEHTDRLFRSAHILGMKMPYDKATLNEAQKLVVRENGLKSGYLRPMAFYGAEAMGISAKTLSTHVIVAAWPWGAYMGAEALTQGIRVKTSSFSRHHVNITMCKAKANGNYMNSILAHREAEQDGYQEALLLDVDGFVAEGSGENFFMLRNGKLYTPDLTAALEGITRDTIIQLAGELGIPVIEKRITRDEVYCADEAFFTGTAAEVTPIRELDNRQIGEGTRGPITTRLQSIYFDCVQGRSTAHAAWLAHV